MTALAGLAAGFAALTALTGLATGFTALAAGLGATAMGSAFFLTALTAAFAGAATLAS